MGGDPAGSRATPLSPSGYGIVSIAAGVVGGATLCVWYFSVPLALLAVVSGVVTLWRPSAAMDRTASLAGVCLGALVLLFWAAAAILWFADIPLLPE